jgi:NitT/TauT family transport system ATP-binding protein
VDGNVIADAGLLLRGVSKSFGPIRAVSDVDLEVQLHTRLAIVGPSGCGKSTLLSLICGLEEPDAGTITVLGGLPPAPATAAPTPAKTATGTAATGTTATGTAATGTTATGTTATGTAATGASAIGGTPSAERLRRCAWMPQRDLLLPWRDVLGNAAIALENRGMRSRAARRQVAPLVERFGLAGFERRLPAELSGGMRQRVSFLRTLVAGKEVLLLDEPFGALDSITRADLQQWLRSALDSEPRTTVLVTHDVEEALLLGHQVAVMSPRPGRIRATFDVDPALTSGGRREVLKRPGFAELRDEVLSVLESAAADAASADANPAPAGPASAAAGS